ncbi:MAG TPA: hypothetical protein VMG13_21890, partial [Trebonia sp.]|nr:hypothetical protein [Trebonia sp.]
SASAPSTASGADAAATPGAGSAPNRRGGRGLVPALDGPSGTPGPLLPVLDSASVRRTAADPMTFEATADAQRITLVPVARAQHKPFTVYWNTDPAL